MLLLPRPLKERSRLMPMDSPATLSEEADEEVVVARTMLLDDTTLEV